MKDKVDYYCVGFTWKGAQPESQLLRFLSDGLWETGYDDKIADIINKVKVGSRLAAKTTYTEKENNKSVSILKIYAIGTVTHNPMDGKSLKVNWDKPSQLFTLKNKEAYRASITRINQLDTVKAIFQGEKTARLDQPVNIYSSESYKDSEPFFPCFVFTKTVWDDFTYKTQFEVDYYESPRKKTVIGLTKILHLESKDTKLPSSFTLDESYCSLGQGNQYYSALKSHVGKEIARYFLDAVNDLAYNRGLLGAFENEDGFKTSLLRSSEAQKALREGKKIIDGLPIENVFDFTFSTQIGIATREHSIKFDYTEKEDLPYRIKVVIGKNGTGKTQFLSNLASTLSGHMPKGNFSTKYVPPFSRVIAVSYSLFDRFPRPLETRTYSYYYCGYQSSKGLLSDTQIQTRVKKAFAILEKARRMHLFGKYLSLVLTEEIALDILDEDFIALNSKEFTLFGAGGNARYSSGQLITILILAELLAYITDESLIIFDEPETHLHPNSISLFVSVINKILERFNSFAIVSTHSPQIIQEVPSKDIIVIERSGNTPSVRGLDIETFGENLNTITERIFYTNSHDEYYREYLLELSKRHSYEKILTMFEENSLSLGLNAKIYLQSLYPL